MGLELAYISGGVILGIAIAYGYIQYKTRNRRNDPVTEAATRSLYDHPETYEKRAEPKLKAEIRE